MKTLIVALLLGVASVAMAAVVPERNEKGASVSGTDMTKKQILVDDLASKDEIKDEDFAGLNRYSNIATKENIDLVRKVNRMMNEHPEKLMEKLDPNSQTTADVKTDAKEGENSESDLIKAHKLALKQMEQIGRKNMGEKSAPIALVPTVEEIKEMGINEYLPDGWEEILANSKEYQEEVNRRKSSGKKLDLNNPEAVAKMVQQFQ